MRLSNRAEKRENRGKRDHTTGGRAQLISDGRQGLPDDERLDGAHIEGLEGVVDAKAVAPRVGRDEVKVRLDELLLLDKLDVRQGLAGQLNRLVEPGLAAVRNVDRLDHLGQQALVKEIRLAKIRLKVGRTGQDNARHVGLRKWVPG